jgi:hypothetical protein
LVKNILPLAKITNYYADCFLSMTNNNNNNNNDKNLALGWHCIERMMKVRPIPKENSVLGSE